MASLKNDQLAWKQFICSTTAFCCFFNAFISLQLPAKTNWKWRNGTSIARCQNRASTPPPLPRGARRRRPTKAITSGSVREWVDIWSPVSEYRENLPCTIFFKHICVLWRRRRVWTNVYVTLLVNGFWDRDIPNGTLFKIKCIIVGFSMVDTDKIRLGSIKFSNWKPNEL